MGPYRDESYTSGNKTIKLELSPLKDLNEGLNSEKVIFGKVVCWIQSTDAVPLCVFNFIQIIMLLNKGKNFYLFHFYSSTFCVVDDEKTCVAVTVYNLAEGRGVTVGDSISIPEPFLINQKFSYSGNVSFNIII